MLRNALWRVFVWKIYELISAWGDKQDDKNLKLVEDK